MTIENLIVNGYLPEELLPVFDTSDLKKVLTDVVKKIDILDPLDKKGGKKLVYTRPVPFSIPKVGGYRRNLSIPHPLHYIRLSKTISDNWPAIIAHTYTSKFSISTLALGKVRPIAKPVFEDLINQRIIRSVGHRYLLKVDIARFYNSIYTHSIPWALHTKVVSKSNRHRSLFGNALDEDCRKMLDGQTMGIPTGPDASRVISEIILSSIDQLLEDNLPPFKGVRMIDDYYLYFRSMGDVEVARSFMHRVLKDFELELNPSKETVIEIPEITESVWYANLKAVRFSNAATLQRKELIAYFDKAFFHAKQFPEENVLSYAIAKIKSTAFQKENLLILQSLLLNGIIQESKTISALAEILTGYYKNKLHLDLDAIKYALEQFIEFHCDLDNEYEISWALWTMKSLKLIIGENTAKKISANTNSIVILVALDLKRSKLIPKGINLKLWRSFMTGDNLRTEHWLLAYEAKLRGWIKTPDKYLAGDPFFKILSEKKVYFYKPNKPLDVSKVKLSGHEPSMIRYDRDDISAKLDYFRRRALVKEAIVNDPFEDLFKKDNPE